MEKEVKFKSVVAAAMLKFDKLDNVDISLLLEDMKRFSIHVFDYGALGEAKKYVSVQEDDCITLNVPNSLERFIDDNKDIRVKDALQRMVVSEEVREYFEKLDVEQFQKRKMAFLKDGKEKLLKNANILLISDIEEEYEELKRYGFSHIDYFKSIIRAERYFENHLDEVEKYHILLMGNQSVVRDVFDRDTFLKSFQKRKDIFKINLSKYDYSTYLDLVAYLPAFNNYRGGKIEESTYPKVFDKIAECAILGNIADNVEVSEFVPMKDEINPNKLSLPTKKEDLKILYLNNHSKLGRGEEISSELGLQVTFMEDNNYSIERNARYVLGDYDIIIASNLFSSRLLRLNKESTEQCKDTGRKLVLLVTYDDEEESLYGSDSNRYLLGYQLKLRYIFGGELASSTSIENKNYCIVQNEKDGEEGYQKEVNTCMRAFLEEVVHIYNEKLEKEHQQRLQKLPFKTAEEHHDEFETTKKAFEEQKENELQPLYDFNSLESSLKSYLYYRNKGLAPRKIEGIEIKEKKDTIEVTNIIQGIPYCAMEIRKQNNMNRLKRFMIQTRTKKGNLGDWEKVGIYTKNYEGVEGVPKPLNEDQQGAFTSICKKVGKVIVPLNSEAYYKEQELEKEQKENPKQKSYSRRNQNRRNYHKK